MKNKTCKVCKEKFESRNSLQIVCCLECAIWHAQNQRNKKIAKEKTNAARELKQAKEAIKTRSEWMREVQIVFNKFIRTRDADKPCISSGVGNISYVSGRPKQTSWDAGHYRTVGSCPELRFNEFNVHKQSVHDNQHLHGNIIQYRIGLIQRIGLKKIEWLEGKHEPKKYNIEELKRLKEEYKQKLKDLNN